jgi:hypothetical protein
VEQRRCPEHLENVAPSHATMGRRRRKRLESRCPCLHSTSGSTAGASLNGPDFLRQTGRFPVTPGLGAWGAARISPGGVIFRSVPADRPERETYTQPMRRLPGAPEKAQRLVESWSVQSVTIGAGAGPERDR